MSRTDKRRRKGGGAPLSGRALPSARPLRILRWYYRRPLLGFFVLFVAVAIWALAPRRWDLAALALPWVLCGLVLLHLPLAFAAATRLSRPVATRRNHALEHGTIQVLLRKQGKRLHLSGKAAPDGFRIAGAPAPNEIAKAFEEFTSLEVADRRALAVADQCGSMIVVAQGYGLLLASLTWLTVTIWRPPSHVLAVLLAAQFVAFMTGRRPLGRLIQEKRLLAFDFHSARIRSIVKVQHRHGQERPPVYFVRTIVDLGGSVVEKWLGE